MKEAIAKLRGIRSALLIDPRRVTTPQALNARIDSFIETLEDCKIEIDPASSDEPAKPKDTSRTRPTKGGNVRVAVKKPEGDAGAEA